MKKLIFPSILCIGFSILNYSCNSITSNNSKMMVDEARHYANSQKKSKYFTKVKAQKVQIGSSQEDLDFSWAFNQPNSLRLSILVADYKNGRGVEVNEAKAKETYQEYLYYCKKEKEKVIDYNKF